MSNSDVPVSQEAFNKSVEGTVDEAISAIKNGRLDTDDPAVVTLREALNDWMRNEGVDRKEAACDEGQAQPSSNAPRGRRQGDREFKKRAQDWGLIVNAGVSKAPQQTVKKEGGRK